MSEPLPIHIFFQFFISNLSLKFCIWTPVTTSLAHVCYLSAHVMHRSSQHTSDYHFEIIFTTSVELVNDGPDLN